MAGHPLRSATDRRLGGPLPHQLPNQTRVHPIPPEFLPLHHAALWSYAVLAVISNCYPPVWGRLPTRYSPVRHSVNLKSIRKLHSNRFVRLACVKHAASVHPEPGSNSHVKKSASRSKFSLANFNRSTVCLVRLNRSEISLFRIFRVVLLFSYQGSLLRCLADSLSSLSQCFLFVNYFFNFLFTHLSFIYKPGRYVLRSAVRFNSLSNIPYLSSCVNYFLDLKFLLNLSPTCIITLGP